MIGQSCESVTMLKKGSHQKIYVHFDIIANDEKVSLT